jgi:hypothetical protein
MSTGGSTQTVGYKYYLGEQQSLCHGPVDALTRIRVDERTAWGGYTSGGRITVNKPELFGGEDREGGVSGDIDIEMGEPTQGQNDYLVAQLGAQISAYRGAVCAVLRQVYLGMNPYLKPWEFRLSRIHTRQDGLPQWYDAKALIRTQGQIISEQAVDLNAVGNCPGSSNAVTVTLTGNAPITLEVVPDGTYQAWSAWSSDGDYRANGKPWLSYFYYSIDGGPATSVFGGISASTANIANALAVAISPVVLNDYGTELKCWIQDSECSDNRGGMSFIVRERCILDDINPAHIVRECLTDPDWGMGYPESDIDDNTFMLAADQLYSEQMGMSLLWDRSISIEDFIAEVLRHIDAVLYVDRNTGKFVLDLIRDDYDAPSLLLLDEANVAEVQNFKRPTPAELTNTITATYWDGCASKDGSVTVHDIALIQLQGGVVEETVQYPGFTNADIASRAATRDLQTRATPLATCVVIADRSASGLVHGSVFRFTWPDEGLDQVVMRVLRIDYGDATNQAVRIECIEDQFGLPQAITASSDSGWISPISSPAPCPHRLAVEAPYYELVQNLGEDGAGVALTSDPDRGYLIVAGDRPSSDAIQAQIRVDAGAGYNEAQPPLAFCPSAILAADIGYTDTAITLQDGVNLNLVKLGTHVQIGDELCRVDAVDSTSATLGRGVLDTVPAPHIAGEVLLFWDVFAATDGIAYVSGETINTKLLPLTGLGQLDESAAPIESVTMAQRAIRPYPPGDLRLDSTSYPDTVASKSVTVSWAHRDRVQQTGGSLIDYTAGNIGPEAGTTYSLTVKDANNNVVNDISGISDTQQPVTINARGLVTLELASVRDGYPSWQMAWVEFTIPGVSYAELVQADGASAYWNCNDASGPLIDSIGGFDLPVTGTPLYQQDGLNDLAVKTSTGNYFLATVADFGIGDTSGAIEVLVNFTTLVSGYIWSTSDAASPDYRAGIATDGDGTVYLYLVNGAGNTRKISTPVALNDGRWHQIVVQSTGSAYLMSVDGDQVTPVIAGADDGLWLSGIPNRDNLGIGVIYLNGGVGGQYDGLVDETAYYPAQLSLLQQLRHAVAAFGGGYYGDVMRSQPVAYWRLGEASGAVAADESGSFDGTYVGNPTLGQASLIGDAGDSAVLFDNVDDHIELASTPVDPTGDFSCEVLVNIPTEGNTGSEQHHTLYGDYKDNTGFVFRITNAINDGGLRPYFQFICAGGDYKHKAAYGYMAHNETHHVVLTWDATARESRIYVEGELTTNPETLYDNGGALVPSAVPAWIGGIPHSGGIQFHNGLMDESILFNKVLTADQVLDRSVRRFEDYAALVMAHAPTAYWRLGDSSGTAAVDETGTYDGTYVGAPTLGTQGLLYSDPDKAVTFNGTSQHVDLPNGLFSSPTAITVQARIKRGAATGNAEYIFALEQGVSLFLWVSGTSSKIAGGGTLASSGWIGTGSSTTVTSEGDELHVALVWEKGVRLSLYVNGELEAENTSLANELLLNASGGNRIAAKSGDTDHYSGVIDEAVLHTGTTLSPTQIKQHSRKGLL